MRGFFGPMIDKWFYALFDNGIGTQAILRAAVPTILFCGSLRLIWSLGDMVRGYLGWWWQIRNQDSLILLLNEYLAGQTMAFHRNSMPGKLYNYMHIIANGFRMMMDYIVVLLSAVIILLMGGYAIAKTQSLFMYLVVGFYLLKSVYICLLLIPVRKLSVAATRHDTQYQADQLDYIENTIITKIFGIKINKTLRESRDRKLSIKYNIHKSWLIISTWAIPNIVEAFLRTALMFICINAFVAGQMSVSDAILVFALMTQVGTIVTRILDGAPDFVETVSRAMFAYNELIKPIEIQDAPNAPNLHDVHGAIKIENVSFAYRRRNVIKNLTLDIRAGEKIGIVGSSGCGKTTLVNLIMRFYDPDKGRILIDGIDIKSVRQDSLHASISYIPQEPTMFNRTLAQNIGYGRDGATMTEIQRVAKLANADKFIRHLANGYDTVVGDRGIKLSGGQRQRIAIARAFLKNAPILILDEATSALDSETESEIQKSFEKLSGGKTTIVIAHRLSTLRKMDRIIVLNRGCVAECGTHAQLVKKRGGIYAGLWRLQMGNAIK